MKLKKRKHNLIDYYRTEVVLIKNQTDYNYFIYCNYVNLRLYEVKKKL